MIFLDNNMTESTKPIQNGGFTLLEVLIAMAILTVSLASIISVESGSINATDRAHQMNIVAMLAKNTMVNTEAKIEGKQFQEIPKEETGQFDAPYDRYSWKVMVKELKFPSLADLGNFNSNGQDNHSGMGTNQITDTISRLMTSYMSNAIREVTVSIFWNRPGDTDSSSTSTQKNPGYSVSMYWVNLNHAFNLSE